MPFKSKQQTKYMYSQHPKIAKKWHDEQIETQGRASFKKLPKRVKGSKMTPSKTKRANVRQKKGGN